MHTEFPPSADASHIPRPCPAAHHKRGGPHRYQVRAASSVFSYCREASFTRHSLDGVALLLGVFLERGLPGGDTLLERDGLVGEGAAGMVGVDVAGVHLLHYCY